jgi:predicted porin
LSNIVAALATLAAAGTSLAQSSVTIYGIIDQGYSSTTAKYAEPGLSEKGILTTTGNQSGLATQRLGFRGVEDLGGGLKARFQVETSLTAGNAGANTFGSRPTFVGLEGGFGTILLGRQDTPLLKAVVPQLAGGANNVTGQIMWSSFMPGMLERTTAAATTANTNAADDGFGRLSRETTINNAINYISPSINGFQAEVQVGQNNAKFNASDITTTIGGKTDDAGVNFRYAAGPLTLSAAMHDQKASTNGAVTRENKNNYVGATYNLGFATVSLQHINSKSTTGATGVQAYNNKGTQFGIQAPLTGAINAFASYGTGTRTFGPVANGAKFENTAMQMGATYSLSKRTRVYAIYGQQDLKGETTQVRGVSAKQTQYALGVNHNF